MIVMGIETATAVCGVALVEHGKALAEQSICEEYAHAEKLMALIDGTLVDGGLSFQRVGAVAVSIGPGSFTGLRIGLSIAKGLSYASDIPLVGVPTLEALVHNVRDQGLLDGSARVLALIAARRDEVYSKLFRVEGTAIIPEGKERDVSVTTVLEELGNWDVVVVGDGSSKLKKALEVHGTRANLVFLDELHSRCSAASVARLGERLLAAGQNSVDETLEPLYIKDFYFRMRGTLHTT